MPSPPTPRYWRRCATSRGFAPACLLVDTAPYADLAQRLEPLAGPQGAYRYSARELLALAAWRVGDRDAAKRWNEAILTDDGAPPSLRSRAEMLRDVMATQAAKAN